MRSALRNRWSGPRLASPGIFEDALRDRLIFAGLGGGPTNGPFSDWSLACNDALPRPAGSGPTSTYFPDLGLSGHIYSGSNYHYVPGLSLGWESPAPSALLYDPDWDGSGTPALWAAENSAGTGLLWPRDLNNMPRPLGPAITLSDLPQGATLDTSDDTLWWTTANDNIIRHITKAGAAAGGNITMTGITAPRHLRYRASSDSLIVCVTATQIREYSASTGSLLNTWNPPGVTNIDGIELDQDGTWWVSDDLSVPSTSADGKVWHFDATFSALTGSPSSFTVVTNVEGLAIVGNTIYTAHDGLFHSNVPLGDRIIPYNYSADGLVARRHLKGPFGVSCFVKPAASMTANGIMADRSGDNGAGISGTFQLTIGSGNKISFRVYTGAGGGSSTTITGATTSVNGTSTWYSIVAWWDGAKLYLWINGKQEVSPVTLSGSATGFDISGVQIGGFFSTSNLWNGRIAAPCWWDRGLSPAEAVRLSNPADLFYHPQRQRARLPVPSATFQPAWARRSSVIIGNGATA